MTDTQDSDTTLARARTLLRAHTTGTLLCDSTPYEVLYIIDPCDGALLICVEHESYDADDCVLVVPHDRFDSPMRITLALREEPESMASDRFLAYHQRQDNPCWTRGIISFVKLDSGGVADGEALMRPNPLLDAIPRLCKQLNNDQRALREVANLLAGVRIEQPVAVGVDEEGCDVRAEFGVVRVQWPAPVENADACEEVIKTLFNEVS